MKLDRIFFGQLLKLTAGYSLWLMAVWVICALAARWGLAGFYVLFAGGVFSCIGFLANLKAKEIRYSRRIKP